MMTPSSSWSITISGVTHLPRPWMTPRLLERSAPVSHYHGAPKSGVAATRTNRPDAAPLFFAGLPADE